MNPEAHQVPILPLLDGRAIPQLGFGVYQLPDAQAPETIGQALATGYRAIDTAAIYGNEAGTGRALRASVVGRGDLFVTTKLWNDAQGFDETLRAFDASLTALDLDDVDLYLIHWPCPERGRFVETWKAFIRLKDEGRVRSIGVSNFQLAQLERIIGETGTVPVLNQIELHPRFQQRAQRDFHARHGIVTQSWSPLGQGQFLDDPVLATIARRHGRSPAQVVLRWHIESGLAVIPKSATPSRIQENFDVFGFTLSAEDHAAIAGLDRADGRIGPDPATFG